MVRVEQTALGWPSHRPEILTFKPQDSRETQNGPAVNNSSSLQKAQAFRETGSTEGGNLNPERGEGKNKSSGVKESLLVKI